MKNDRADWRVLAFPFGSRDKRKYKMKKSPFVFALTLVMATSIFAQQDVAIRGTLIELGNSNGVVVMTDSMQTVGDRQLPEPGQKLMKYNDELVCAIAGLGGLDVPAMPKLSIKTMGVVAAYRDNETLHGRTRSIAEKLEGISALLRFYLDTTADLDEIAAGYESNLTLQLMLVGYDLDKTLKVGLLELSGSPLISGNTRRWQFRENSITILPPLLSLTYQFRGMPKIAWDIMLHPDKYPLPSVKRYSKAMDKDNGTSMTLDEIKSLASDLIEETAKKYRQVGGPKQTAILAGGKVKSLVQPIFPEIPRPFTFTGLSQIELNGGMPQMTDEQVVFFEDVLFNRISIPIRLDNRVYLHCQVRDSIVEYDGGGTIFEKTNTVYNSSLRFASGDLANTKLGQQLLWNFPWNGVYPATPPFRQP